jgi:hypothetical protein
VAPTTNYKRIGNVCRKKLKERDHLEKLGVGGRIILNRICEKHSVDWTELNQNKINGDIL